MSNGTKRPTFKESSNGIITLPISSNFTSCKVSTTTKTIQTLTTSGQTKILESYTTKNGIDKVPIYTKNSENYIYNKESKKPINTIPATGRTAKIIEPYQTNSKHLKLPIYSFDNANNLHPLDNYLPLKTITTNTSKSGTSEKILLPLDDQINNDLLVVKWNEQLWNVRILTELECFRLMGFDDEDFYKAQAVATRTNLYHVAGNSIVVKILEAIFKELFKGYKWKD